MRRLVPFLPDQIQNAFGKNGHLDSRVAGSIFQPHPGGLGPTLSRNPDSPGQGQFLGKLSQVVTRAEAELPHRGRILRRRQYVG